MKEKDFPDLRVDFNAIRSYADYQDFWDRLAPVEAVMIEKYETCRHEPGDRFVFRNHYEKPEGICSALHHVLQLYLLRASLGFPSWEADPRVYRIHCPDRKGSIWAVRRAT